MKVHVRLHPPRNGGSVEHAAGYGPALRLAEMLGADLPRRSIEHGNATYLTSEMVRHTNLTGDEGVAGDAIIIEDLTFLVPAPAVFVQHFARRGLQVYVARLGPTPLNASLPLIEMACEVYADMPRKLDQARRELAETEGRWKAIYDATVASALVNAIQTAAPRLLAAMPVLGETNGKDGVTTPEHIGEVIRVERERAGWTITELARRADVDGSAISRLESGERTEGSARDKALAALYLDPAKVVERHRAAVIIENNTGQSTPVAQIVAGAGA